MLRLKIIIFALKNNFEFYLHNILQNDRLMKAQNKYFRNQHFLIILILPYSILFSHFICFIYLLFF